MTKLEVVLGTHALIYLILMIFQFAVDWQGEQQEPPVVGAERLFMDAPLPSVFPEEPYGKIKLAAWHWEGRGEDGFSAPLILLHGSPSNGGRDFQNLAPAFSSLGMEVYAIDRLGWGGSDPFPGDYSFVSDARAVLAFMDERGIEKAHLAGWSYSGGVILELTRLAPDRVLSLNLMGAIGLQACEGSGSYHFEHFKYGVGGVLLEAIAFLIPDFGKLPSKQERRATVGDFQDADQRPLEALMMDLSMPCLILQGVYDPLVPSWAAAEHHRLIRNSRLVMLDASHFFPLGGPMGSEVGFQRCLDETLRFVKEVEESGTVKRERLDEHGEPDLRFPLFGGLIKRGFKPWWLVLLAVTGLAFVGFRLAIVMGGLLMSGLYLDFGVVILGCLLGKTLALSVDRVRRRSWRYWIGGLMAAFGLPVLFAVGGVLLVSLLKPILRPSPAYLVAGCLLYSLARIYPRKERSQAVKSENCLSVKV